MYNNLLADALLALKGQFSPSSLGSRLFMERAELDTPEEFLVWFHERFHYLQVVFTPYGHLKWAAYRTSTVDIVEAWAKLSTLLKQPRKLPIREYLLDDTYEGLKLAYNVWFHDLKNDLYKIVEQGATTYQSIHLFDGLTFETCCPIISLNEHEYRLRGIDILESFAKFEEAMGKVFLLHKIILSCEFFYIQPSTARENPPVRNHRKQETNQRDLPPFFQYISYKLRIIHRFLRTTKLRTAS